MSMLITTFHRTKITNALKYSPKLPLIPQFRHFSRRTCFSDFSFVKNVFSSKSTKTSNKTQNSKNNDYNKKIIDDLLKNLKKINNNGGGSSRPFGNISLLALAIFAVMTLPDVFRVAHSYFNVDKPMSYNRFESNFLAKKRVKEIEIDENTDCIRFKTPDGACFSIQIEEGSKEIERKIERFQSDMGVKATDHIPIKHTANVKNRLAYHLTDIFFLLFIGALIFVERIPSLIPSLGTKSTLAAAKSTTRFADVAGLHSAKFEVAEVAEFLRDSRRFRALGARVPRGVLLSGPPGVGKTLLARAVAGETDCHFFSMSGAEFSQIFVGVGARRVRELFAEARRRAPAIVFIDEIDTLGGKRGERLGSSEKSNTLNQLLVEMDGFAANEDVVVMAGTNRPDMLDKALLRPGRFDRKITLDLPDIKERAEIFNLYLKKVKHAGDRNAIAKRLAALTPDFSGADIANVCNEGAIFAARRKAEKVEFSDFESAFDRVLAGLSKSGSVLSARERRIVAHHEAGHAVCAWYLEHADPLLKVTVKPRVGGVMGFSQHLPKEVRIYTKEQLLDQMCVALGGRVAEHMFFGQYSTGSTDDLKKTTSIAYKMARQFGMSDRVGDLSFPENGNSAEWTYSQGLAEIIDEEVTAIITALNAKTQALLKQKKAEISKLAEALLARETLNHDEVVELLGKRPFQSFHYKNYLESIKSFVNEKAEDIKKNVEKVITPQPAAQ